MPAGRGDLRSGCQRLTLMTYESLEDYWFWLHIDDYGTPHSRIGDWLCRVFGEL